MARRRRRGGDGPLGFVILVVLIAWAGAWIFDQVKALWPLLVVAAAIGVGILALSYGLDWIGRRRDARLDAEAAEDERVRLIAARQRRRIDLLARFGREDVVDLILAGQIWHDMSKEELLESWGPPADVATKVLKTKIRETYKYDPVGAGRYRRKALLENDRVIGWEE